MAVLTLLLAACQTTSNPRGTSADADGLTAESAVRVSSVQAERQWIQKHYPGAEVESQALLMGKVPMDLITIQLPSGEKVDVYFDISAFFGKW
ncbi:hypothetical protein ASD72_11135 [Pseudoxanthomonas sp. Root630]|nr:hypothetical protein ASD72_11135 [Pseudoxanthomonas sp. Root630]